MNTAWRLDATKILSVAEMASVIADLKQRATRSANARQNLCLFRLAACCGLRVSEIITLTLDDVRPMIARPHIRIRRSASKNGKARIVPLWWDGMTLADIAAWKRERQDMSAVGGDALICMLSSAKRGNAITRFNARRRFKTCCRILGAERISSLTVHHGRHSFISHALAGGRTLAEVRDAAGHSSLAITSIYTHVAIDDDGRIGDLFAFSAAAEGRAR